MYFIYIIYIYITSILYSYIYNMYTHIISYMRWLILCVNLIGPQGTQIFGQTLFWVFLWVCFGMRLIFKCVDWVKQIFLPNVRASSNDLKVCIEQRGWPSLSRRVSIACLLLNWNYSLPGSRACRPSDCNHTISSPGLRPSDSNQKFTLDPHLQLDESSCRY